MKSGFKKITGAEWDIISATIFAILFIALFIYTCIKCQA